MSDKIMASGKYLKFIERDGYEMIERINCSGVVVIVPLTADGKIVLIDQYRKALDKRVVELPAGLVNDVAGSAKESLEDAGRRELLEETGYEATGPLTPLGIWPTSSGMCSELVHVFLARGATKVAEGGGDDSEDINVHAIEPAKAGEFLCKMAGKGCLIDPKIYAALYLARA